MRSWLSESIQMSVFCYASRRLVSFIGTWEDSEGWGFTKISEGSKHPEIAAGDSY